ncbi:MAG TPA: DUF3160 domain-containing protein, partial [Polyangiaceae bacterium]|nr:DUF3160 domain-containing protein [Polyangiaceae bacterium]
MRLLSYAVVLAGLTAFTNWGCAPKEQNIGSGDPQGTGGTKSIPDGPIFKVTATEDVPAPLQQIIETSHAMDGAALTAAYPAPAIAALTYDPKTASGMELIQASPLALNANELSVLGANGLVISKRTEFPSFAYGYKSIYAADLPVYVSADSILEAVHRTFDTLLTQNEQLVLINELGAMLAGMRTRLVDATFEESAKKDVDLYLTVAASLLAGQELA